MNKQTMFILALALVIFIVKMMLVNAFPNRHGFVRLNWKKLWDCFRARPAEQKHLGN